MNGLKFRLAAAAVLAVCMASGGASGADAYPGTEVHRTPYGYKALIGRLDRAVKANGMGLVTRASATVGAKRIGVAIPGNMVVGVFAPRFAVRMLKADVAAGIHAPIRFYITENADRTATLSYRKPSAIFAPYANGELDRMSAELDAVFAGIVRAVLSDK